MASRLRVIEYSPPEIPASSHPGHVKTRRHADDDVARCCPTTAQAWRGALTVHSGLHAATTAQCNDQSLTRKTSPAAVRRLRRLIGHSAVASHTGRDAGLIRTIISNQQMTFYWHVINMIFHFYVNLAAMADYKSH